MMVSKGHCECFSMMQSSHFPATDDLITSNPSTILVHTIFCNVLSLTWLSCWCHVLRFTGWCSDWATIACGGGSMKLTMNMVPSIRQWRKGFLSMLNRVAPVWSISIFTPFCINDPTYIRLCIRSEAYSTFLKVISITSPLYQAHFWTHLHPIILNSPPFAVDATAFPDAGTLYVIKSDLLVKKCWLAAESAAVFIGYMVNVRYWILLALLAEMTVVFAWRVVLELALLFRIALILIAMVNAFCDCLFPFFY